jgi:anti-anti-sigma factor
MTTQALSGRNTVLCFRKFGFRSSIVLKVKIEESGNAVILHCIGRIVRGHETAIMCAAVRQSGRKIVLDLSKVDAIDAAGVGALIALQAAGIYLQLMNPTRAVREVLRVTKVDSVFEIRNSQRNKEDSRQKRSAGLLTPALASAS